MYKIRIILTVLVVLAYVATSSAWNTVKAPVLTQAGVAQVEENAITYGAAQRLAQGAPWAENSLAIGLAVVLLLIWRAPLWRTLKGSSSTRAIGVLLGGLFLSSSLTGCRGPYMTELYEEIEPYETAFVIPLEGDSSAQAKFDSEEYLNEKKVLAKRITIPQRQVKLGRMWFDYKWIPTARVIRVDRTPLAREWTQVATTGTSPTNQAIVVESSESIGFALGVAVTAQVEEPNAAKFLYRYPSGSLKEVMDSVIRNTVTQFLSTEFGSRTLAQGILDKADIFARLKTTLIDEYGQYGITVTTVGLSEGLTYTNSEVQTSIDDVFKASRAATQQAVTNTKDLAKARTAYTTTVLAGQAQGDAVREFVASLGDVNAQNYLTNKELENTANWIKAWQETGGKVPQFYSGGANGGVFLNVPIGPTQVP